MRTRWRTIQAYVWLVLTACVSTSGWDESSSLLEKGYEQGFGFARSTVGDKGIRVTKAMRFEIEGPGAQTFTVDMQPHRLTKSKAGNGYQYFPAEYGEFNVSNAMLGYQRLGYDSPQVWMHGDIIGIRKDSVTDELCWFFSNTIWARKKHKAEGVYVWGRPLTEQELFAIEEFNIEVVAKTDSEKESQTDRRQRPIQIPVFSGKPDSTGSGFVVSNEGLILTAFHVVENQKKIVVTFRDGDSYSARVLESNRGKDIALLQVIADDRLLGGVIVRSKFKALPVVASDQAAIGSKVFTVGFPLVDLLGREPKYTEGSLSSRSGLFGESSLLQVTIPIQPGNSGGPIIVLETGQVIGIVTSSMAIKTLYRETGTLPQNINWGIKSEFALPMFRARGAVRSSEENIVENALQSTCLIEVWK